MKDRDRKREETVKKVKIKINRGVWWKRRDIKGQGMDKRKKGKEVQMKKSKALNLNSSTLYLFSTNKKVCFVLLVASEQNELKGR